MAKPKTQAQIDHATDARLLKKYGVGLAWYVSQLEKQGGGCAITGKPPGTKRLHVDHDHSWTKAALPWASFSGAALGTGVMMGAAWAYESLSFGGYWAWDPVENASLVPWIVLIAGLHTLIVYRSTGRSLTKATAPKRFSIVFCAAKATAKPPTPSPARIALVLYPHEAKIKIAASRKMPMRMTRTPRGRTE